MTDVLRDSEDWWWVECPCGYLEGPFDSQEYAFDDAREHECPEEIEERDWDD